MTKMEELLEATGNLSFQSDEERDKFMALLNGAFEEMSQRIDEQLAEADARIKQAREQSENNLFHAYQCAALSGLSAIPDMDDEEAAGRALRRATYALDNFAKVEKAFIEETAKKTT